MFWFLQNLDFFPTGRGIDADHLLISAELGHRNIQDNSVDVESALTVERLVRTGEREVQIEDALNIGVESVVTLAGKNAVTGGIGRDGLRRVVIQSARSGYAFLGRVFAVIALIVEASYQTLVIRRDDHVAEDRDRCSALCGL